MLMVFIVGIRRQAHVLHILCIAGVRTVESAFTERLTWRNACNQTMLPAFSEIPPAAESTSSSRIVRTA